MRTQNWIYGGEMRMCVGLWQKLMKLFHLCSFSVHIIVDEGAQSSR